MTSTDEDLAAHAAIAELLAMRRGIEQLDFPAKGFELHAAMTAWGWWSRIVRSAGAVSHLHDVGFGHEASPMVRAVLHHSAALEWLIREPAEAVEAVAWEHAKEANKMYGKATAQAWKLSGAFVPTKPVGDPPAGFELLRNTEKLAQRIGSPDLYVAFLAESKYSHPTMASGGAFWNVVDDRVHLVDAPTATPLRGVSTFATIATAQFAGFAGLVDMEARARAMLVEGGFSVGDGSGP